jgi:hypothetical protein
MGEISYPDSNRVGCALLSHDTLQQDRAMVGALLAMCTVIAVEDHESGRGKRFILAGPMFDELKEGEEIPEYRIEFVYDQPFENQDWQARRVNSGNFGFAFFRKTIIRVPALNVGIRSNAPHHLH